MTWAYVLYAVVAAAFLAVAAVLVFGNRWLRDKPPHQPDHPLRAAQHRVTDDGRRPGSDDQWADMTATVPNLRIAAAAEKAAEANTRLGGE